MKKVLIIIALAVTFHPLLCQEIGNVAQINGIEMYYEVHGSGEALVLLHGFFSTGDFWNASIEVLSSQFQVIVPDLRGHGKSTNPLEHWTMEQSARDIFALLDHLGIENVRSIGFSTGAKTLLHMATQNPQRLKAIVLIGGTMYYPEKFREAVKTGSFTIDKVTDEQWEELRAEHIHGDEQIRKLYRQFNDCAEDYEDMSFTPPILKTISAKTLIIHGDHDFAYPTDIPTEMYNSIPNSYLWIVPNGGHWPFDHKNYKSFLKTTINFLTEWN